MMMAVCFERYGPLYYPDPGGHSPGLGDKVLVPTDSGPARAQGGGAAQWGARGSRRVDGGGVRRGGPRPGRGGAGRGGGARDRPRGRGGAAGGDRAVRA